jgi:MYXO-CTERM domain-containing protein
MALAGCGNETSGAIGQDHFEGELEQTIATFADGTTVRSYFLRQADGDHPQLIFSSEPDLAPGDPIAVWGTRTGGDIAVQSARSLLSARDVAARESALVNAAVKPAKRMAFVLVDMGGTATLTKAQAVEKLFSDVAPPDTSIANYYTEESYGIQTLVGDVFGPLTYPALTTCENADTTNLATTLRPMITGTYDQYGWYFLQDTVCTWGGLAQVGTAAKPARDTWFDASSGCVVLVQEPGHNYGMNHSSSIKCGTALPLTDDVTACVHDEYGDPFDPMGKGCYHMNMYQKAYEGWVGGCNSVKVTASDTFDIFPMESACNAIQVLQVPMPKVRPFTRPAAGGGSGGVTNLGFYYIEYRQPFGNYEKAAGNLYQGVLIHAGEDYRLGTQAARYPYLLDMNPATTTFNDAALAVGKTFTDPAGGVSITLVSASATKATVQIQITGGSGAPSCINGTTVSAPGPQSCGAAAGGTGGATGAPGTGGATGTPGTGGAAGGIGGATGSPGTGGARGATGGGGDGGVVTGSDAAAPSGPGGASGSPTGAGGDGRGQSSPVSGGCACDSAGASGSGAPASWGVWAVLALAGAAARPRRRQRRS